MLIIKLRDGERIEFEDVDAEAGPQFTTIYKSETVTMREKRTTPRWFRPDEVRYVDKEIEQRQVIGVVASADIVWMRQTAQGTSGSAQDRHGLDPEGAGPVPNGDAPDA